MIPRVVVGAGLVTTLFWGVLSLLLLPSGDAFILGSKTCDPNWECKSAFLEWDGYWFCQDDNVRCAPKTIFSENVWLIHPDEECGICDNNDNVQKCLCRCTTLLFEQDGFEVNLPLLFGLLEIRLCLGEATALALSVGAEPSVNCVPPRDCRG